MANVIATETGLTATSVQPNVNLTPNTTYYWTVTAVNGEGSTTSPVWSFTTAELPTEPLMVEDFESYADDAALTAAYVRNDGGGKITTALVPNSETGSTAAKLAFDLGTPGYAGVVHTIEPQSWWGRPGLSLELDGPVGARLSVQFVAAGGYWEAQVPITQEGLHTVEVPFEQFEAPSWAGESQMDLSSVTELNLYLGDLATGELLVDNIQVLAATEVPAPVETEPVSLVPTCVAPVSPEPTGSSTSQPTVAPTATESAITDPTAMTPGATPTDGNTPAALGQLPSTGSSLSPALIVLAVIALGTGAALMVRSARRRS
jgi:LPXTG-motif cell wall-anchored protein